MSSTKPGGTTDPTGTAERRADAGGHPQDDDTADTAVPGSVRLRDVTHQYGRGDQAVTAVGPVDLTVPAGEFLVLVGASGCGKSTLLRLIAGFERPTQGSVEVSGATPRPGRAAGMVFQQPRLFPWRTVRGNIDLALRYAGVSRDQWPGRRDELLRRVGLEDVEQRRTWEISGGQQQRVAIARALAAENPLFLLDEPFAALDALTRERLQEDIRRVTAQTGRTAVFVTHSADEAVFLGTRIVVLTKGPGTVALDLPIDLPRGDVGADELRESARFGELRARVSHAVKAAAA
ncbi:ABC transporter ATP-binding protein [Actinacidiphila alni]|uniref:ABC transporter ATP-binding protein n=1 Tax=Actinacidiphila alni TaxID=380248 RepID=UPI003451D3C8